jgi:hypothetical protein
MMEAKELLVFLDLAQDLRMCKERCEEEWKAKSKIEDLRLLEGKAQGYMDSEKRLRDLLRDLNS